MYCHQPLPHYDLFFLSFFKIIIIILPRFHWPRNMGGQYVKEGSSMSSKQFDDYRSLVLPPHGLNPWEDATLPPHGLNLWEYSRHEPFVLPPHETNHREDALPSTTWTQSRGGPFVKNEGSNVAEPFFSNYPGGMSVVQIRLWTIWMLPNLPHPHTDPGLSLHH